jgi:hypothetical protein
MIIDLGFVSNPVFQSAVVSILSIIIIVPYIIRRTTKQIFKKITSSKGREVSVDTRIDKTILKKAVNDLTNPINPIGAVLSFFPSVQEHLKSRPESVVGVLRMIDSISNMGNIASVLKTQTKAPNPNPYGYANADLNDKFK